MIGALTNDHDIVAISETWLPECISDSELGLHGYSIYRCDRDYENRTESKGGGVLIAVRNHIKSYLVSSENSNIYESLFIKVWLCNRPILINISYIPPQSNSNQYEQLTNFLDSEIRKETNKSGIILLGDYNLASLVGSPTENEGQACMSYDDQDLTLQSGIILDFCNFHKLNQVNNIRNYKDKTLDLIFSNLNTIQVSRCCQPFIPEDPNHPSLSLLLYLEKNSKETDTKTEKLSVHSFKKANYDGIFNILNNVNWTNEFKELNLDQSVSKFYDIINGSISSFVPKVTVGDFKFPKWVSNELKQIIINKKKSHKQFKLSKSQSDYITFSNLRTQCKTLAKVAYENYCKETETQLRKNPKSFWNFMSEKRITKGLPSVMHFNELSSHDGKEIANFFAQNFASVYSNEIIVPQQFPYNKFAQLDHNHIHFSESEIKDSLVKMKEGQRRELMGSLLCSLENARHNSPVP